MARKTPQTGYAWDRRKRESTPEHENGTHNDSDNDNDTQEKINNTKKNASQIQMEEVQFDEYTAEMKEIMEKFQKRRSYNIDFAYGNEEHAENNEMKNNHEQENDIDALDQEDLAALSRKKFKKATRLSVAELKQLASRPEVVDIHDVNAPDPKLLITLKAASNTVPVPAHWSAKSKFLSRKRGFEKPPFLLPDFIQATGIAKVREGQVEKDAAKNSKQLMRQRMQPKLGRLDIDYQVLYTAFFRWQTKPRMTKHGELYYEGKEFEVHTGTVLPGVISDQLRSALGMKDEFSPPPWLFAMQRFGPPPGYPNLKVPGVNSPIPSGARWGFGENEWGKPPVDALGRPLFGDVFGVVAAEEEERPNYELWGRIEEEVYEDENHEELQANIEEPRSPESEQEVEEPTSTSASISQPSIAATSMAHVNPARRHLFEVLEEKQTDIGSGLFGTTHTYVVPPTSGIAATEAELARKADAAKSERRGQVEVAIDSDEFATFDSASLKRKYDEALAQKAISERNDADDSKKRRAFFK